MRENLPHLQDISLWDKWGWCIPELLFLTFYGLVVFTFAKMIEAGIKKYYKDK